MRKEESRRGNKRKGSNKTTVQGGRKNGGKELKSRYSNECKRKEGNNILLQK